MPPLATPLSLLTLALLATLPTHAFGMGSVPPESTAAASVVTGSAAYRERIALPPDAVFEAVVEDVSRADAPALVIGQQRLTSIGQVPIAFAIPYDAAQVQANHSYNVRARILHGTTLLFTTTQHYPVLTRGAGDVAGDVLLQRVTKAAASPAAVSPDRSVTDTYWKLVELDGGAVTVQPNQREPHMVLQAAGNRLAGFSGCNRMTGSFTIERARIAFGQMATTRMACIHGMELEAAFGQALGKVRAFEIKGDALSLRDESGRVLARFVAVDLT